MNQQLTILLYAVQCLRSFRYVYSMEPTVRVQNEHRNVAGEVILST